MPSAVHSDVLHKLRAQYLAAVGLDVVYQRCEDALGDAAFAPAHIKAVLVLQRCMSQTWIAKCWACALAVQACVDNTQICKLLGHVLCTR
jgi:hypothetical protein